MESKKEKYMLAVSEKYQDESRKVIPCGAVYAGFADKTSAHGISHVRQAKGPVKIFYWVFFSLAATGGLLYYGETLIERFFSWPVSVQVTVQNEPELTFPAITVCNMNPVKLTSVEQDEYIRNLLGITVPEPPTKGRKKRQLNQNNGQQGQGPPNQQTPNQQDQQTQNQQGQNQQQTPEKRAPTNNKGQSLKVNFEKNLQFQQYIADLSEAVKSEMGHPISDFILDCEFAGYECYTSDFYAFYNSKYGNCYVFNSGWNSSNTDLEVSRRPGPEYGLSLIFNIDQDEYVGTFADSAGVRVVIHDQNVMPFPEDEGITVTPGGVTYIGIRKEVISRLSSPFSNCTKQVDENKNVYQQYYPVEYTTQACLKTCIQKHNIESCNCASSKYPKEGIAFGNVNITTCDLTDATQDDCVVSVMRKYKNGKLDCQCTQPCEESLYTKSISTGYWPSNAYREELFTTLRTENTKAAMVIVDAVDPEKYKKNFVKVTLYFEEFNLNTITEQEDYPAGQFVSDIGGILGLFIGFSVLTILEFVELLVDLMVLCCAKCCQVNRRGFKRRGQISMTDSSSSFHKGSITSSPPPYNKNDYTPRAQKIIYKSSQSPFFISNSKEDWPDL